MKNMSHKHMLFTLEILTFFLILMSVLTTNHILAQPGLTGVWTSNDGGTYYIHQIGRDVWWVGLSNGNGNFFTNVFHGTIQGSYVFGQWSDVPLGRTHNWGTLTLQIISVSHLIRVGQTGQFSGSDWNRR
jgi:hypothetical protein